MKLTKEKVYRICSTTLVILLLVFLAIVFIRKVFFNRSDILGYRVYVVMSGSMIPTININDAVITKEKADYNVGDIIAFDEQDSVTVHRIIDITVEDDEVYYKTKGDANNSEDLWKVSKKQIKGIVILRIPKLGDIIIFIKNNIPIVIVWIILIIICYKIFKIILKRRKNMNGNK